MPANSALNDFIFGTLADDALRLAHARAAWSGVTHRRRACPRDPLPGQPITLALTAGPGQPRDRAWVYWTDDGSDPAGARGVASNGCVTPMAPAGEDWSLLLWGYVQRFEARLPGQPAGTVLRYRLSVAGEAGAGDEVFADDGAFHALYVDDDPPPAWACDAVVYHVFVDRFHPGRGRAWQHPPDLSGFYGGTLRGVTERLDYIADLGANVIWLSPIFPSPSHHGYDATDLFDVEPRLGSRADLKMLLHEAHQRSLRVLLDLVPNHVSSRHPCFQQAATDPASPYRDWFTFERWPDRYVTFFGVRELPQINLRQPAARQHVLDHARHWLDFGVDGFRVDYAIGPTPDFWAEFRRVTRAAKPDCWTFGEVVDPPDAQLAFEGVLDGCLDFVLLEAFRQALAFGAWDARRFAAFLDRHEAYFPSSFSRPSFLDNHDMNRFLWAAQGDQRRLRLAALCQFSLAGPPIVYYGTEAGLSQARDVRQAGFGRLEEARLPMVWEGEQDAALRDFYRRLIALRHAHPALRRGARATLAVDEHTLAYARAVGDDRVVAALNLSVNERDIALDPGAPSSILFATQDGCWAGAEAGRTLVHLPPLSGALLQ
jgi:glycosidase